MVEGSPRQRRGYMVDGGDSKYPDSRSKDNNGVPHGTADYSDRKASITRSARIPPGYLLVSYWIAESSGV
jgi:hypothetical protein